MESDEQLTPNPRSPITQIGGRRTFLALLWGALMGAAVGCGVNLLLSKVHVIEGPSTRLLVIGLLIGMVFGAMWTLAAATMSASLLFSQRESANPVWITVILALLIPIGLGMGVMTGFLAASTLDTGFIAGDAVLPFCVQAGGIIGTLLPCSLMVSKVVMLGFER
jgi:hypothetical protein